MKITIGSKNPIKIASVTEAAEMYPDFFTNPEFTAIDVPVELFGHPKSLEETVSGAIKRARAAFIDADYSFGIEGGLMAVPHTKSGFMEVGVCAIYDGANIHLGLSSAFEWPKKAFDLIVNHGMDGSQAVREAGITSHEKIGASDGIISILTKGKVTRKDKTRDSVIMAITHLLNPDLF